MRSLPSPFVSQSGWQFSRWLLLLTTTFLLGACVPSSPPPALTSFSGRPTETPTAAGRDTQAPTVAPATPTKAASVTPTSDLALSIATPSLSPLSGRFVFEHGGNLSIVNASCVQRAGTCERESVRLTDVPDGFEVAGSWDLTASPDGNKIAFVYRKYDTTTTLETGDIYVLDVAECVAIEGGCPPERFVRLTTDPGKDSSPAWSPQGDRIIFTRQDLGPYSYGRHLLYEMKPDGSQQQLLMSEARQHDLGPHQVSWSPDGTRLVMSAYGDTRLPVIFVLRLSDFQLQQITHLPSEPDEGQHSRPRWSPRGDKIVFEGDPFFDFGGYLINPDGTGLTRLPLDNGPTRFAWSPDASKFIYTGSCKPNGTCLFLANADGSEPQQLTQHWAPTATLWLP